MSSKDFLQLKEKVVIITGSSAGIGEAIALEFAQQGCQLTLCGRNTERLESVATKCREILKASSGSSKVLIVNGDVVDSEVQKRIIDETLETFGHIDILVNNVGMNIARKVETSSREDYDTVMKTNLDSVFFLSQLVLPHLKNTKGNIVNISSIVSVQPAHNCVAYSMSKAALDSLTKCLAMEMAPHGVRVNSVNPGSVVSLLYRRGEDSMTDEQYEKFVKAQSSTSIHPLGRMVQASEVADACVYLASCRASFITGQAVFVDGGRHCVGPQPQLG